MGNGNFKKNVIESLWEAVISTGVKSRELFYVRTESEYVAKTNAQEHADEIKGTLISLRMIADHGERISEPTEIYLLKDTEE